MITLKLPYTTSKEFYELLSQLRRQQSNLVRFIYNRIKDGCSEMEIRKKVKYLNNCDLLDSWFVSSAFYKVKRFPTKKKVIFGGRWLFLQWIRTKKKEYSEKWKGKRLLPLVSIGDASQKGNRKFELNVIEKNQIIFKYNKKIHFNLQLPKLRKNIKKNLFLLELLAENRRLPISYELDDDYIYISFDEGYLRLNEYNPIKDRIASIDLNPNYVGFVVKDWTTDRILYKEVISIKPLNDYENSLKGKGISSSDERRKYITNKRKYEIIEIAKRLANISRHFRVEAFVIEKLNIRAGNKGKGHRFNKLVNNQWNRTVFVNNLKKRCNLVGIKLLEVYPQYSSTIGCLMHPDEPDMIASAIELNRRGYKFLNYDKKASVIFPPFDKSSLSCRWKDKMKDIILSSNGWKDLHDKIKKSGLRYRFLIGDYLKKFLQSVFSSHDKRRFWEVYQLS